MVVKLLSLQRPSIEIARTSSDNTDFITLVQLLDADLARRDGSEHSFYAQFNAINNIRHVVVAYENGRLVGCGAIKEFAPGIMEVKRMYTVAESRGKGVASRILQELERWAAELSCNKCVLETGKRLPEAIELYKKNGYRITANLWPVCGY
ncbi:MAG TPA: GNAT family N-acetyltransferase [Chitinophagaceae bacterium]|nr:GNAT family N-acetyltransferase [Chitinophagaceae bacterium]